MLIYGGQAENNIYINEMIVCHLDNYEWQKIQLK